MDARYLPELTTYPKETGDMRKLLIAFALVAGLVAHAGGASAQTVGDVETRDQLIAAQENLLND